MENINLDGQALVWLEETKEKILSGQARVVKISEDFESARIFGNEIKHTGNVRLTIQLFEPGLIKV